MDLTVNNNLKKKGAIFIMPRSSSDWRRSEALWITVAGWASAARRTLGWATILTTDRLGTPEEVLNYPFKQIEDIENKNRKHRYIPNIIITLIKDFLLWRFVNNRNNYSYEFSFKGEEVTLVWEHHDLFGGPGRKLANKYGVPLIKYVHAPQVWEAAKWGVRRPLWGKMLEKIELRNLTNSDLVACVSEEVAEKLIQMGVQKEKVVISPMAVDAEIFEPKPKDAALMKKFSLETKTVIGWTGSFRKFHGIDLLVRSFAKIANNKPELILMLVGEGQEKPSIEQLVKDLSLGKQVRFSGRVDFTDIPNYVSVFDIAVVSARSNEGFHYSPLKLREYMCSGKVSLAPNAGEIPIIFRDGENIVLYEAGNIDDLSSKMAYLIQNPELCDSLSTNGREHILKNGTWEVELNKAFKFL